MNRASCCLVAGAGVLLAATASLQPAMSQPASSSGAAALNFEVFKSKVQPVFLAKRPGHTRCVVCHTINNAPFHLVPLSPGSTTWSEEQSRQNFQLIERVVVPGFEGSKLLTHPLAEEAGGDPHHGGGQQFASQADPEWQALKAFVLGATPK